MTSPAQLPAIRFPPGRHCLPTPPRGRAGARSRDTSHNFRAHPAAALGSAAPPGGAHGARRRRGPSVRRCRTRPGPRTKRQNGGRWHYHVTPFVPFGASRRGPQLPGGAGRRERGPRRSAGGRRGKGPLGSAPSFLRPPPPGGRGERGEDGGHFVLAQRRRWGPGCGGDGGTRPRGGGVSRTDSSSFSMPVGICGTARLMEAYSAKSGRSSQRKTGSGLDASSARARNDSLLMLGGDGGSGWGGGGGSKSAPS